jgi:predicted permease
VAFFNATMADSTPPFWVDVRVDGRVLFFTAVLTAGAALASSLAPALRASRIGIFGVLKDAGRSTAGLRMIRFSRILVVAEIVLSFTLLLVSGLLIKSVLAVMRIEIPFRTDLLHARFMLPDKPYGNSAATLRAVDRLLELVASEPGVTGAAVTTSLPDNAGTEPVMADNVPPEPSVERRPRSREFAVSAGFFRVMRIAPVQGRVFDARDREGQPPVAIVTADLARRLFNGDALGRRIQVGADPSSPWRTIVGVVPRLVFANVTSASTPPDAVIVPIAQVPSRWMRLLVASDGDPARAADAARRAVARLDPDLPLSEISTVAALYHDQSWPIRLFGTIFASFGLAALLLSAAGLYGVMAFRVRSRTQEIGVRMALGANPREIVWMVLRQGAVLLIVGMAIGLGLGGWLSQQMRLLLFAVRPWDPVVIGAIAAVLAAAGLTATLIPAWRAASIDPMAALREQ